MPASRAVGVGLVQELPQLLHGVDHLARDLVHEIDRAAAAFDRSCEHGAWSLAELLEPIRDLVDQREQTYRDSLRRRVRLPDQIELARETVVVLVRLLLHCDRHADEADLHQVTVHR